MKPGTVWSCCLVFSLFASGCSSLLQSSHQSRYENTLQPLLNHATEKEMLNHYGPPERKVPYDEGESWLYFIPIGESEYTALDDYVAGGKHPELYDCLTLYFDSLGTFVDWRVIVSQKPDEQSIQPPVP